MTSPSADAGAVPPRTGDQRPRLWTAPPQASTAAGEAIDLAASSGLHLDDWQRWFLSHALGERDDGKWAAFEVCLIVSRQNGKGSILEARELFGLFLAGEELIMHSAHEFKTSSEAFRRVLSLVEANPSLDRQVQNVRTSHGEEGIELRARPALILGPGAADNRPPVTPRLRFIARSTTSGRGFTGDLLIYDEAMILDAEDVGATIPVLSARDYATEAGPQVWYTGSAGIGAKSTQLAVIRHRVFNDRAARLCFAEWSADPHTRECRRDCADHAGDDVSAAATWRKANPAYGIRITHEAIERERDAISDDRQFGIERLGVGDYPMPKNGWVVISRRRWEETALTEADPPRPSRPAFAIDTTPGREATSIGLAGGRDDGLVQVELADHLAGTSWVVDRVVELDRRWRPVTWVIDPAGAARTFIEDLQAKGLKLWLPTLRDVGAAYGDFVDAVRDDQLRHSADRDFGFALAGAGNRRVGDQKTWDRNSSAVDISPIVAVTLALAGHRKYTRRGYDILKSVAGPSGGGGWDDDDARGWH